MYKEICILHAVEGNARVGYLILGSIIVSFEAIAREKFSSCNSL